MKTVKLMATVLSFIIIFSVVTACSGNNGGSSGNNNAESAGSKGADGRTPLTMWFWGAAPEQRDVLQKVLIDKFNNMQDKYELNIEYRASVNKDIGVALAASEGPDIVYESSPSLIMKYVEAGKVDSLETYAEKYGWKDKLIGALYESSTVEGKLYSIPMGLNVIGMVYNKKVLEQNGWSVPTTIDALVDVMEQAKAKGLYASVTGNKGWQPTNEDYTSLFLTHFAKAETVRKALTNEIDWNNPEIAFAVEKSKEWFQNGYLGGKDYTNLDWGSSAQLLAEGRSPFFFGPTKFLQNAPSFFTGDAKNDLGFAPFPAGIEGIGERYAFGATGVLGINANSKHKDAAAEVINMIINKDFVAEMARDWPGYWGVPLKDLDIDTSKLDGVSKTFFEAMQLAVDAIGKGNFGFYASSYMPSNTFDILGVNIDTVWYDQESTEQILKKADEAFDKEYNKDELPPVPQPN